MAEQTFEGRYPTLARWVLAEGWLELGRDERSRSLIRILDAGGLIWEGGEDMTSLSGALAEAERALFAWLEQQGGLR